MFNHLKIQTIISLITIFIFANSAQSEEIIQLGGKNLLTIETDALYPEGIEYNPYSGEFLLNSFREGAVYAVNQKGDFRLFIKDKRLITGMGLRVDAKRNRLYVVTSDLGVSKRKSELGPKSFASLGIYELSSGKPISFINLATLRPKSEKHIANDITIDGRGNVYVTDSLAPVIYKIDLTGRPSVFLESKKDFSGEGFNLNGIVYHPDGFLIVAKKNEGFLFKIPLSNPNNYTKIQSNLNLIGADGLVLINKHKLVVITNRAAGVKSDTVFTLTSSDGWKTGHVTDKYTFTADEYPTTGTLKDGKVFVVYSRINRLIFNKAEEQAEGFSQKSIIQQVGTIKK
ncbi:MAG: hypothetical protein JJ964_06025 [Rhizobiales bacterium]|nr:hypothetical protein [Hyphomicrobiales bacterium]